jgi:ferritin-like protein
MLIRSNPLVTGVTTNRRALLRGVGTVGLSAAAIAIIGGCESMAASNSASAGDVDILNTALGLEHEAINAYQLGAESGLLEKPVLNTAVLFQSHHKAHRDALADTVRKLGGTPVAEQAMDAYVKSSKLNVAAIKSQGDVLALAQRLELGAANAYLGVIPAFGDRELAKIAGRLAADETMHYTALTQALGGKLPSGALSFGG